MSIRVHACLAGGWAVGACAHAGGERRLGVGSWLARELKGGGGWWLVAGWLLRTVDDADGVQVPEGESELRGEELRLDWREGALRQLLQRY
jgi:hypothetical protein